MPLQRTRVAPRRSPLNGRPLGGTEAAWRLVALVVLCTVGLVGCSRGGKLRGTAKPSTDGLTYLVVENDNGGKCGTILVDGKPWQHPIGTPGKVEAGRHTIDCGGEISVEIEPGMTFYFNYWGP